MTSKEALYQLNEIALGSKSVKENNWYYRDIILKDLEVLEKLKTHIINQRDVILLRIGEEDEYYIEVKKWLSEVNE